MRLIIEREKLLRIRFNSRRAKEAALNGKE